MHHHREKPVNLPPLDEERIGYWYYGSSGSGKTHAAGTDYPNAYRKNAESKWWCEYNDEDFVIIDDFDKWHKAQGRNNKVIDWFILNMTHKCIKQHNHTLLFKRH